MATIENVVGGAVDMTSYALRSDNGLLDDGFSGALGTDWTTSASSRHVAELNLSGSQTLEVGAKLNVGNPYVAGNISPAEEDIVFQYTTADGKLVDGIVEFTGALNDLVLHVDPADGSAAIANLSRFIAAPELTGYAIRSESGSLRADEWTSLATSGQAGDGWTEASPAASHLAELNLTKAIVIGNGSLFDLGKILGDDATPDLQFLYTTTDGEILSGTVQYGAIPTVSGLLGDCSGDGQLTAADLNCISTLDDRDAVLGALNTLPGDLDGDGTVAFADFLVLSGNFGDSSKTRYSEGNIDLADGVTFADFLALSGNFGLSPAGTPATVPEPGGWGILVTAVGMLMALRRPAT